ncbi:MAG: sialidase family protein [Ktedonobacteraceae bacterium]
MAFQSRRAWGLGICLMMALALVFTGFTSSTFASAASVATPKAEKLTQLSSDPYTNKSSQHKTEVEPDTFSYGSTIVSAFQVGRFTTGGASNIGWATSTDNGKTWKHGFLPGTTVYAGGTLFSISDAAVAYDAMHKVWLISTLGITNIDTYVLTSRSTDGGLTWSKPILVSLGGTDKNWIVCDDTASSPNYGHCYTEWDSSVSNTHFNMVLMSTSTDGGQTWSFPRNPVGTPNGIGGQPLVQPNGTVIVPILGETQRTSFIASFSSKDGGKSWSGYTVVTQVTSAIDPGNIRSGPLPTAEIDGSGKVYVVWEDCRFEKNCSTNDLVMSTSSDGKTWSAVQRIPADPVGSGVDHFIPGLGVDKTTGGSSAHLALMYYYYANVNCTVSTCQLYVGFISSTNSGASWSKKEQIAGPMHLKWLANAFGYFVGDYISTSFAASGEAYSVFAVATAPVNGVFNEAMYTTPEHALQVTGGTITSQGDAVLSTHGTAFVRHSAF